VLVLKATRLKEKLDKLKEEMGKLAAYAKQMLASPNNQISLTDPDSRWMATSGRGSGVVGYNVQVAVDLKFYYANEEHGQKMRRYWTNACKTCAIKDRCTTGKERRITRWEHEHVLETVQQRLDQNPQAMRRRRETVEHQFGTLKMRMGATHFLMKTLPKVASEMALSVLAYNLTRVMNIVGTRALLAAIRA
jgi:macrodomain Ter protein organizer (MatP/YcbG family)